MYVDNPCSVNVDSGVDFGDSAEHRGDTDVIRLNV